jgi:hypothetical protein
MGNLKIYGVPLSRAYRALWMANELGLDYEISHPFRRRECQDPGISRGESERPDPGHR